MAKKAPPPPPRKASKPPSRSSGEIPAMPLMPTAKLGSGVAAPKAPPSKAMPTLPKNSGKGAKALMKR